MAKRAACVLLVLWTTLTATEAVRATEVDVDAILASSRLMDAHVGCLLNRRPCLPEAALLKRLLPEALATNCATCSAKQRSAALKVIAHMTATRPKDWSDLVAMYDPTGAYRRRLRQQG